MSEKKTPEPITERDGVHLQWYEEAKSMTVEALAEFVRKLTQDYAHDYGTICHAIAAAGIAAMWAVEKSPQGGITGFQGSCITWELIQRWGGIHGPARIVQFEEMLYPQYVGHFRSISAESWAHVQAKAKESLEGKNSDLMHPDVRAHMERVVAGEIPFGYSIEG